MRTTLGALGALAIALGLGACGASEEAAPAEDTAAAPVYAPGPGEPTLDEIRALTEKYKDINVALAEGYIRDPFDLCEVAENMGKPPEMGAMGVHYFRPDLAGVTEPPSPRVAGVGTHTDFRAPTVLLYEPQADGSLELVGVENLVFEAGWTAAGKTEAPTFHGLAYDYMADDPATELDEAHMFAPHYDRHVWVFRDNPNGVFTSFNPAVSCAHHTGAMGHAMP